MSDRPQDAEIAVEQAYLDRVYARLGAMRRSAERVAEAYSEVRAGGTHQARLERDIAVETTHRRLAALDIGDTPLCFGRLDGIDNSRFYVGRIGVDDEEHTPLVIDWRAPVAEPFYRATAVEPMGVLRRRHLLTRHGREVIGLDDEVFDPDAAVAAGFMVMGEGALMAALERERTGRMADIVATIQAEQDEAIRADLAGALIVAGGPGTGKTAVALHRAAYLLYTHRRRLAGQGVLLIGPSTVFLRYIEQVLPSLGEHETQLATMAGLKPQHRVTGTDTPEAAALKGDARMVTMLRRALADRERPLRRDLRVVIDGEALRLARREGARLLERARRRRGTHNARRPFVERLLLDHLARQHRGLARTDDPEAEQEMRARIRRLPEVRAALERMWPVLTGAELVHDLFSFDGLVRSAAEGVLPKAQHRLLVRARSASVREVPWTESDIALIDEADALVGPTDAAWPRRKARRSAMEREALDTATRVVQEMGLGAFTTAESLAARFAEPAPARNGSSSEPRVFGHVVVDEAQDLTPMQWRMLARRCPNGSMTLVGDFGQASRPGAAGGWDDVLRLIPTHHPPRHVNLTVNYRTPAEIMEVANRLLAVAAPDVEPTNAVRATGEYPRFRAVDDVIAGAAAAARRARMTGGTVAVIAPPGRHEALTEALAGDGAVAQSADVLDAPIGVLGPLDAKGLEFDHVVVVEPAELVTPDRAGLRLLFVTLTRATRTLEVVHSAPLPEALTS